MCGVIWGICRSHYLSNIKSLLAVVIKGEEHLKGLTKSQSRVVSNTPYLAFRSRFNLDVIHQSRAHHSASLCFATAFAAPPRHRSAPEHRPSALPDRIRRWEIRGRWSA